MSCLYYFIVPVKMDALKRVDFESSENVVSFSLGSIFRKTLFNQRLMNHSYIMWSIWLGKIYYPDKNVYQMLPKSHC